jgi:hypothetical protein
MFFFDMTKLSCLINLRFDRCRLLIHILLNNKYSEIAVPTVEKIQEYKDMVHLHHPPLQDVWCTMDGIKLKI